MSSLHDLQTRMLDALLSPAAEPAALLEAPAVTVIATAGAAARLAVYRNTVRANLVAALRSTFPAVWRLVGEDYFGQVVRRFALRHPSRSGDLRHVGEPFPAYLAELHADDEYRYLSDVARLELLIQDASLAAEHAPLDLAALAQVAPAAYDTLQFILHPALRLFESAYPVQRIWDSNVGCDAEPDAIDLASGGDQLAVLRCRMQLQFHRVSRGEWVFLGALSRGDAFAAAIDAATASAAEFDAGAALRRFAALGAVVDFRCPV